MLKIMLRLWFVVTIGWVAYNLYIYRDKLSTFADRDWRQALDYGVNNVLCDLKIPTLCHEVSVSLFRRTDVNETFGFIVTFVGWPLLLLIACLIIAWIIRAPKRAR